MCYDSDCSCLSHDIINAWRKHFNIGDKAAYLRCVACLLTYSMEQSPSWEGNQFSASQEIPRILWNLKVHYRIHKCLPPVPIKVCCYFTVMLGHMLHTPPQSCWMPGICNIFPIYRTVLTLPAWTFTYLADWKHISEVIGFHVAKNQSLGLAVALRVWHILPGLGKSHRTLCKMLKQAWWHCWKIKYWCPYIFFLGCGDIIGAWLD